MRGREDEEVTAFVRARYGPLVRTAFLLCGDRGKAEDLVQTTLAKTVVAWPRLRRSEGIDHYVQRVLVNTFVTWRRRRSWWEQPLGRLVDSQARDEYVGWSSGTCSAGRWTGCRRGSAPPSYCASTRTCPSRTRRRRWVVRWARSKVFHPGACRLCGSTGLRPTLLLNTRCAVHNPTELRDGLAELAEPVIPTEGYEGRIMRRADRLRARRRVAAGAAAAVCLAVLVTMVRVVGFGSTPQLAASPPDGPFLGWSAVGDVDAGLVRKATGVWDRTNSAGPHTAVRALVATHHPGFGSAVVVLQGYDEQGAARLAFFTGDSGAADALRMRVDRPAPDPVQTRVISLVSPRLTGAVGVVAKGTYVIAIAIAMPGVTAVRVSTTAVDDQMIQDPDGPTSRLVVERFPIEATAQTVTIAGFVKPKRPFAKATKVFEVPGEDGATGDVRAVPAEVVSRNGQQIVVAYPKDQVVRQGQLAVVAGGLVGRVTAVDAVRGQATVDLVTSNGFTGQVYTSISNVPGSVRGTGGQLVMEGIPADGDVYQTNRVVMPDPSQQSNQVGAVTIGRASADKAAGATTVELTPTADLAHLTTLSIMTPSAD